MDPRYKSLLGLYKLPFFVQDILRLLVKPIYPRMAHTLTAMPRNTSGQHEFKEPPCVSFDLFLELRKKYEAIEQYRYQYVAAMQELGLDAILCPITVSLTEDPKY